MHTSKFSSTPVWTMAPRRNMLKPSTTVPGPGKYEKLGQGVIDRANADFSFGRDARSKDKQKNAEVVGPGHYETNNTTLNKTMCAP